MKASNQGWHRADIKAGLEKRGWTLAEVGRRLGHRHKQTAYRVLYKPYPMMERIVADILGVPPKRIWPERYNADGSPKGAIRRKEYPKFATFGNGNRGTAA